MSRVAQAVSSKLLLVPAIVVVLGAAAGGVWWHTDHRSHVQTTLNAQHQLTQLSYRGQHGVNALTLLKEHASVKTKHYSFGDFVTAIDGVNGNGPKYWTFYVNNHQSSVGAGAYVTKNSDHLTWKLQ